MTPKFMSPVLTSPLNSGLYPAAYLTFPLGCTVQNLGWLFFFLSTASGLNRTSDLLSPTSFSLPCLSHFSKCLHCPLRSDQIKNLILYFSFIHPVPAGPFVSNIYSETIFIFLVTIMVQISSHLCLG